MVQLESDAERDNQQPRGVHLVGGRLGDRAESRSQSLTNL